MKRKVLTMDQYILLEAIDNYFEKYMNTESEENIKAYNRIRDKIISMEEEYTQN